MSTSSTDTQSTPFVEMLGVRVQALSLRDLNATLSRTIEQGRQVVIAHHNLHSVYLSHHDEQMRRFYARAHFVHIDGMPLVHIGRWHGHPLEPNHRVTYVDWMGPLMSEAAARGWRIFYLGSKPGVAERGAERLREVHRGLQIHTHHGYFDAADDGAENTAVLDEIAAYRPNVLLVGMGMPRQERWILANLQRLTANVILPCGAAIDYVAGAVPTPPRWAGRLGLEWAFRLYSEPRRLWRRYLVEPWFIIGLLMSPRSKPSSKQ